MGVSWKLDQERIYRGFRFVVTDLPEEFQSSEKWRDYLFANRVPGYVENDFMLRDAHLRRPDDLLCRDWPASTEAVTVIETESAIGRHGWYSFNPNPADNTHNCVTWAFSALNRSLGEILPPVRDGRMKLAINVLLEHGAHGSR